MGSRSLKELLSDTVDSVKGTYDRARARDTARAAPRPSAPVVRPSRPTNPTSGIRDLAPDSISKRRQNINKAVDDNS